MKKYSLLMTVIMVVSVSACARADLSKSREAYILSQPHGWIEITVSDESVPSDVPPEDLSAEEKKMWEPRPPSCSFAIKLNNEEYLYEPVFPFGPEPLYKVDSGFRFPVPAGEFEIVIRYNGCDSADGKMTALSFTSNILIEENRVTPVFFDGDSISILESKENSIITLDDIYEKLNQITRE